MVEKLAGTKAHTRYRLRDGTLVPGVTTVLGILNKPALIHWAWTLGMQGIDYRKFKDAAAVIGTCAHLMIQHDLQNTTPNLREFSPEVIDKAENAFLKWLEWKRQHAIDVIYCERQLVSEKYRYGGTIDCLAKVDGDLTILDLKTSKSIYTEYLYQVAAYRQLAAEDGHKAVSCRILQIGRTEDEGFSERSETDTTRCFALFRHALAIYELQRNERTEARG